MNRKKEVTHLAKARKQRNTHWHQNLSQKSPQNPFFVVWKWSSQKVVLFLTLKVVLFLTLERLKRGTKTNSPAYIYICMYVCMYIYIYVCCRVKNLSKIWPFLSQKAVLDLAFFESNIWPRLSQKSVQDLFLLVFSPVFSAVGLSKKHK